MLLASVQVIPSGTSQPLCILIVIVWIWTYGGLSNDSAADPQYNLSGIAYLSQYIG